MGTQKIDKRIVRTRRMIRNALTELMMEKGFEGITVSDITAKADINRGTFYKHYRDKYDLLEQSENELLREIEAIVIHTQQIGRHNAMAYIQKNEPLPHVLQLVEYFLKNLSFIKTILGPKGDPSFQVKLKEVMKKNMLIHFEGQLKKGKLLVPADYLIAYVSSANLGVIQHWLENEIDQTPEEIALILSIVTILGPGYVAGFK
ncbi:TetR/AcrR family transcriptional regulator [Bacillus marinisedimentorum]|uniref:TetR/AcrR family transcriptional regulator n=1 Tax=Bacillus marinisedimentorum TaxID=1821260 RepID=UPI0009F27ED3|nr:TetR/AcrR family transcriptional regulator [Bacillus marinisedimentorum]